MEWQLREEECDERPDKLRDSAPGGDGLPYSCWKVGDVWGALLRELHCFLLGQGELPPDFIGRLA
eukprot:2105878-Pyramimonas_sp.AAC.1